MFKSAILACLVCGAASTAVSQEIADWQSDVGGWHVAVDRTIKDSCFIISEFESDVLLRLQINATLNEVQLIVADMGWSALEAGAKYPLELVLDDNDAWIGEGLARYWSGVLPSLVVSIPVREHAAAQFMGEFAGGHSIAISNAGTPLANLELSGTGAAVRELMTCQSAFENGTAGFS